MFIGPPSRPLERRFRAIGKAKTTLAARHTALFGPWSDIWIRYGWRVQTHCLTSQARALNPAGEEMAAGAPQECMELAANSSPATF